MRRRVRQQGSIKIFRRISDTKPLQPNSTHMPPSLPAMHLALRHIAAALRRMFGGHMGNLPPLTHVTLGAAKGAGLPPMQHDMAIVICTVCRESLLRAVRSLYAQTHSGPLQVLIGVDVDAFGQESRLKEIIFRECPPHIQIIWISLGYSTSARHGGVHSCHYGGSLRTSLSFLANARYVMYLDDDDWLAPQHCSEILQAIEGKKWAFAYSIYADGNTGQGICVDSVESVGVGQGVYNEHSGGFVRPSGLALDKTQVPYLLHLWSASPHATGDCEDRLVFGQLRQLEHGCTGKASVYYSLDPKDSMHENRMQFIREQGADYTGDAKHQSCR
jgi:hypothetical protein